ncbi:MAG: helix-turn-helix domain-containing protein [Isosphaeraceae bacterium]
MKDKPSTQHSPAGMEIIEGLTEFLDVLRAKEPIEQKFTVRDVVLKLEPREYGADEVKQTRKLLNISQVIFAQLLGVSVKTVRGWEQGLKPPSPIARRFMDEFNIAPDYWMKRLRDMYQSRGAQPVGP